MPTFQMAYRLFLIGASGALGAITLESARIWGVQVIGTFASRPFPGGVQFRAESDSLAGLGVASGDTVIFLPAHSDQEWVRTHINEARALNVDATVRIAAEARRAGAHLVFMSSEAVFGVDRPYGWQESAEPCPTTVYGQLKAEAERALVPFGNVCIVRTGWNVTQRLSDRCVVRETYEALIAGTARLATDNVFSLTDAEDTAQALLAIALERKTGIFHAVSGIPVSRTAMADEIIRLSKRGARMRYRSILFSDLQLVERKAASAWLAATSDSALRRTAFRLPQAVIQRKTALLDKVTDGHYAR